MTLVLCRSDLDEGLVLELMRTWKDNGSANSFNVKRLHRLTYFAKASGLPLRLIFELNTSGPYSYDLEEKLHRLTIDEVVSPLEEGNFPDVEPELADSITRETETGRFSQAIREVVSRFAALDSPELDLLSTVHYVSVSGGYQRDDDWVIKLMRQVRGTRFTADQIKWALNELRGLGLMSVNGKSAAASSP